MAHLRKKECLGQDLLVSSFHLIFPIFLLLTSLSSDFFIFFPDGERTPLSLILQAVVKVGACTPVVFRVGTTCPC